LNGSLYFARTSAARFLCAFADWARGELCAVERGA
jgi:hypothetical protein